MEWGVWWARTVCGAEPWRCQECRGCVPSLQRLQEHGRRLPRDREVAARLVDIGARESRLHKFAPSHSFSFFHHHQSATATRTRAQTEDLDPEFLKERASKLDEYVKYLLRTLKGSGRARAQDRAALVRFLVDGQQVELPGQQDDLEELNQLLREWRQPVPEPIWDKYVVALFGTTSAGKSSLINHLVGFPLCRTSVCSPIHTHAHAVQDHKPLTLHAHRWAKSTWASR